MNCKENFSTSDAELKPRFEIQRHEEKPVRAMEISKEKSRIIKFHRFGHATIRVFIICYLRISQLPCASHWEAAAVALLLSRAVMPAHPG